MELDGQRILIYNDTDDVVNDLYFLLPGTTIKSKVKKCKPNMHVEEHVLSGYKGDLKFYFKENKDEIICFNNAIGIPKEDSLYGIDAMKKHVLVFRIQNENDKRIIIQDK